MTLPARPSVEIIEEGMREGMQIESAGISVAAKVELLDALSATGLRHIVVGSFVSPRWVPQMAAIEEILAKFTPNPDVTYTALALNAKGAERRAAFVPPLAPPDGIGRSMVHLCDVFVQRNTARTVADELSALPRAVADQATGGATEATVAVNAAWGSNWLGEFTQQQRTECIERQMEAWSAAGIATTGVYLGDPMSWNTPRAVRSQLREIVRICVEVVALPGLIGAPMPSSVVCDAAVSVGSQEDHLVFPRIGAQRPAVTEDDRLSIAPVFVIDLRAIFCRDSRHISPPSSA